MGLFGFGKKKEEDDDSDTEDAGLDDDEQFLEDDSKTAVKEEMNVGVEIVRMKAQIESFGELRKTVQDRFSRASEQTGELRGMIMDTNKSLQEIEVKVVKSIDLVESVQPDKLMVEVKRQDAKIEGLSAKIETNKSFIDTLLTDIKELRRVISQFKGIEETIKMNDDVKKELRAMERMKATVERHGDKAETLFVEIQKKVTEMDNLNAKVSDLDKGFNQILQEFDVLKVKFSNKSDKKEIEDILGKMEKFEKHYGKVVELLSDQTANLKKFFDTEITDRFSETDKVKKVLIDLTHDNPKLEKHLETIQNMAAEEEAKKKLAEKEGKGEGDKKEEKTGVISKFKGLFGSKKKDEEETPKEDGIGEGDMKPVE